jgi:V/A-type H+-transporting ATPase subunit I
MIEPMKQVSVICLAKDREATVDRLGDLGTVHVVAVNTPSSPKVDELSEELSRAEQALLLLEGADADEPIAPGDSAMNASEVVDKVLKAEGQIECEDEAQVDFLQFHEELVHWGSFSKELLKELQDKGVAIRLGCGLVKRLPDPPEGWTLHVVNTVGKEAYFVLVSECEQELPEDWDFLPVPHMTSLDEIASGLEKSRERKVRLRRELAGLRPFESEVSEYLEQVRIELAFAEAHAGMGEAETLAYLTGYIPACNTDQLLRAASEQGWGVRLDDPAKEDEKVPTLLRLPKALKLSKTIFDFIGILPGYREVDVSSSMLIFLTIFFGMIIGDGGYGAVFLAIALFFCNRVQSDSGRRALKLFGVLSVTTLVWGFLTGNRKTARLYAGYRSLDESRRRRSAVGQSGHSMALLFHRRRAFVDGAVLECDPRIFARETPCRIGRGRLGVVFVGQFFHGRGFDRLQGDVPGVREMAVYPWCGIDSGLRGQLERCWWHHECTVQFHQQLCRCSFVHPVVRSRVVQFLYCKKL